MTENSDLVFAEEAEDEGDGLAPWPILLVDDEEEIHAVTKLALSGFEFSGRKLDFISAYSGEQARQIMSSRPDIAMILLDVVMETDHAGLDTARYIRETLQNSFVRIILRTGQPGQAPERDVITDYDINDYKEKTELTSKKLYTVVYTALRSYRDLMSLEANRKGMIKVLGAASNLFKVDSVDDLIQGVLEQLAALIYDDHDIAYICSAVAATRTEDGERIVAATGRFKQGVGQEPVHAMTPSDYNNLSLAMRKQRSVITANHFSGYFVAPRGTEHLLYLSGDTPLAPPDQELIDLFLQNVAIVYETLMIRDEYNAIDKSAPAVADDEPEQPERIDTQTS